MGRIIGYQDGEIDKVIRSRVCARCYGRLDKRPIEGRRWAAICPVHGNIELIGHVSKSWAEHLGQQYIAEYWEVKENYPDLFGRQEARQAGVVLQELGSA